jgi:NitT/TauT family transport system substrate-binding protein/sulfonate transport system substrate-binding protein
MVFPPLGRRKFFNRVLFSVTASTIALPISSGSPDPQANSAASSSPLTSPAVSIDQGTVLRVGFISTESKLPVEPEGWAPPKGLLSQELQSLGIKQVKLIPFEPVKPPISIEREWVALREIRLQPFV